MFSQFFGPAFIASFIACSVEVTEMVIIVVGVGVARGWRSTIVGALSGLTVLAAIVLGLGRALQLVPINPLRVVIGGLLLTFGLQWLRQGVVGIAADGFTGAQEEAEDQDAGGGPRQAGGGLLDWTAWLLAFKGVLLEGLEVAFIVIAFGAGSGTGGSWLQAYAGAAAALLVIGTTGIAAKGILEKVPGRSLKFAVGGLLSTFGTFWSMEGLGVRWPAERLSLLWLYVLYLAMTFALAALARRGVLGPAPLPSRPADAREGEPVTAAPVTDGSIRLFQRTRGLERSGVVDPPTQAAIRAERLESGQDLDDPSGVDPAAPASVAAFQRRHGLPTTGTVDDATRGALRASLIPDLPDADDADAVRRFQRDHGVEPTGQWDDTTRLAWHTTVDTGADDGSVLSAYRRFDALSGASVLAFQQALGLRPDGDLSAETRGALLALRGLVGRLDPDADGDRWRCEGTEPDPLDRDQVGDLQSRYGLVADGRIDETTRQALRWEHEHLLGVDVASPDSVRAFQRRNRLRADGVVGPRTQAVMHAVRHARAEGRGVDQKDRYGSAREHAAGFGVGLDPADAESVRRFQNGHGLDPDGVIGPETQVALRAQRALLTREGSAGR